MSISLKVVSDAAVSCDSFRRSEMRGHMRFTFTRISFLLPGAAGGGEESGFVPFGLDGGWAGLVSVIGGGGASFHFCGGRGEVSLPPGRQLSSDPQERSRLGV